MTTPDDARLERLERLTASGDVAAAAELFEQAERRHDDASRERALAVLLSPRAPQEGRDRLLARWVAQTLAFPVEPERARGELERLERALPAASFEVHQRLAHRCLDVALRVIGRGAIPSFMDPLVARHLGVEGESLIDHFERLRDPRGAYMEVARQIAERRYEEGAGSELYQRERRLRGEAKARWAPWIEGLGWLEIPWGLPMTLCLYPRVISESLERGLDAWPVNRTVSLLPYDGLTLEMASEIAETPALSRVRRFTFSNTGAPSEAFARLFRSSHFTGLRTLFMSLQRNLDDAALLALVDNPSAGELRSLDVTRSAVGDASMIALGQSAIAPHLEELSLSSTQVSTSGLLAIARLPRLRSLNISHLSFAGRQVLEALTEAEHLEELSLRGVSVGEEVTWMMQQGRFPSLKAVEIDGQGRVTLEELELQGARS